MKRIIFLSAFILLAPTLIYAQVIFPNRGGTGTTTIPTTGQVLVAQPNGTYGPQATSTLGISGGSSTGLATTSIDTESELENILTDVTNVFTNNDGSLSDDDLSNNTTSDLLEGTNLYYTVARIQSALTAGYNSIFGNSTTTNATTTNLAVTNSFNFLGTVITNVSTWFNGLFNTQFATKTTDNLTEGTTNKYNKISTSTTPTNGNLSYWTSSNTLGSVATGTLTETVSGLQLDNTRGLVGGSAILSLTSGFTIPSTTDITNWNTAYSWGNHASQGYLSTTSGDWTGTVDGNNFAGGAIGSGDMLYGSGAGAISELGIGASSTLLVSNGSTPFWITGPSICNAITGGSALCDGDDATGAGGGITTLNSLINSTQTFAVGTSSNIGIGIVSSGSTHTFTPTLASGFSVPSTSDFTNWNTAFGWGNHASVGYLSTTSGNWLGTFDGQEGSYYLSRANHTGTQSSTTITGLGTLAGLSSVDISANTNLTAGDALTLTDDDLDFDGGATPQGELGGTWASPTIDDSLAVTSWNLTTPTLTSFFGTPCTGNTFLQDIGDSGAFTCVSASNTAYLATSSPWTNGNLAYVTGQGSVGSVATGTLTETVSGLELNATRALIGGSSILAITSGYEVPLTASTSNWQIAFASTTAMTPTYTRGLFSNTATGLTYTGATGITALTAGYNIPLIASTTEWSGFYTTPSTRITAGANCSWAGNTFDCSGGGGGGGGALSTTTDIIGDGGVQDVSYVTGDVMFGGNSSTTAEFQLDDDGAKLIISSTTNSNATATIESGNSAQAVRIGDDSGVGIENIFSTAGDIITRFYGGITEWIMDLAKVAITGKLYVATTTYNGATTSDAIVTDGYINSGEWIEEFCTSPASETTQIVADTLKGCGRFTYIEDVAGVLDFVVPTTGTSTYFRIRTGATGTTNTAGDGFGIGWTSGIDFGDIQRNQPAMEWAMRTDAMGNATSSFMVAGITDRIGLTPTFEIEPAQGFYIIATSTTNNWQFACNPPTGSTTFINTGIATTTVTSLSPTTNNPFTHWRLEVAGTTNTAVTAVLKARTVSNKNFTQVGTCTIDVSASTQLVAPTIGNGRVSAGTLSAELHLMWLKFWYKQPVF